MVTIRASRKGLPYVHMRMEHTEFMFCTEGCVAAVEWQDNKPVTVLSTYHIPKLVSCMIQKNKDGTSSVTPCPATGAEHNAIMRGVDSLDQRRDTCSQEVLIKMGAPSAVLSEGPCDHEQFIILNCNSSG
jgi:hypothetical protein